MKMILKVFASVLGGILGVITVLFFQLFVGDGLHFIPFDEFIIPLIYSALIGAFIGYIFHKIIYRIFNLLGNFFE